MRLLLNRIIGSISYEKELVKELTNMAQHLRKLDCNPDEKLTRENAEFILGKTLNPLCYRNVYLEVLCHVADIIQTRSCQY